MTIDPKPLDLSKRTDPFQESVIREMTRIGEAVGGVDLGQGLPDFAPPRRSWMPCAASVISPQTDAAIPWS